MVFSLLSFFLLSFFFSFFFSFWFKGGWGVFCLFFLFENRLITPVPRRLEGPFRQPAPSPTKRPRSSRKTEESGPETPGPDPLINRFDK